MPDFFKKPESREEWLAMRQVGVGGSEVAAILGLSPWQTPVDVWMRKTGRKTDDSPTLAMSLGTELEDFVAQLYTKETGRKVRNYGYMIKKGNLIADVDRLVCIGDAMPAYHEEIRTEGMLECKTAQYGWCSDGVPLYYQTQVQHYLGLTGCAWCDVACLSFSPKEFKVYRIERDDDAIRMMAYKVDEWWQRHVVGDVPPEAVNLEDVRAIYRKSSEETVVASDEIASAVAELTALESSMKSMEANADALKAKICEALGDADTLLDTNGAKLATWKSSKGRTTVDYKGACLAAGIPLDSWTKTSEGSRTLRICAK